MQAINSISNQNQMPLLLPVFSDDDSLDKKLKSVRTKIYKQTQEGMAALLGVSLDTYKSWERANKGRKPSGGSKVLIDIAIYHPQVILELRKSAVNDEGPMQDQNEVMQMA